MHRELHEDPEDFVAAPESGNQLAGEVLQTGKLLGINAVGDEDMVIVRGCAVLKECILSIEVLEG